MSPPPDASALFARLQECMIADRAPLRRRLRGALRRRRGGGPDSDALRRLEADIAASEARRASRRENRPGVTYPSGLPIAQRRDDIAAALRDHQVLVVCGETGSGKSTQLPKICLDLGRGTGGLIGLTQPRRIAARTIATRIAAELGGEPGRVVGYAVRFTDVTSPDAYIRVMTDGILLAEIPGDRDLARYDTIIIDEAHERSLNIDFLLGYLRRLLPRRPDLTLIVSSATIDPHRFAAHLGGVPVVEVSGRSHPVDLRYRPPPGADPDEDDPVMQRAIVAAVGEACAEGPGDVLVFLSGEREIRATSKSLRGRFGGAEVLPLYARLPAAEQMRAFEPSRGRRRIVLATNVAETSLTVPGVRFVVDPGLARISRYSTRARIERLPVEPISRASAIQRAGRCGRLGPGVCIRLYAQEDFEKRPAYTPPEILRSNLAGVILRMKALNLGDPAAFPFLEPPPRAAVRDGYATLQELGALDEAGELTEIGRRLARLPVDPRIGRMILAADVEGCLDEVITIAAALSVQDPRERPADRADAADEARRLFEHAESDFLSWLALWDRYQEMHRTRSRSGERAWCHEAFVSFVRMREWADVRRQLLALVGRGGRPRGTARAADQSIHRALLTGLLGTVGARGRDRVFEGPRSLRFHIHPGSALFRKPPRWVMAAEIVDTTRRYARCVARIEPEWIEQVGAHLLQRSYSDPRFDDHSGQVVASQRLTLWGLEVVSGRRAPYAPVDPAAARQIFIREGLVRGRYRTRAPFATHNRRLVEEVRDLEARRRRRDLLADEAALHSFYESRVGQDVSGGPDFERWRRSAEEARPDLLHMTRRDLLRPGAEDGPVAGAPDALRVGDLDLPLSYRFEPGAADDGVTLTVPLALLGQVPAQRLEWGVPALLGEKITAMIRSLPPELRRRLIPAPDWAAACAARLEFGRGSLREALSAVLERLGGMSVPPGAFDAEGLPDHLRLRLRVVDEEGREVAAGRDADDLLRRLGRSAQQSFARLAGESSARRGVVRFDFGELPQRVDLPGGAAGHPALLDRGDSVELSVLSSAPAAEAATRLGLRRLFLLQVADELRELLDWLPGLDELERLYAPLGPAAELREAVSLLVAERAFLGDGVWPRRAADLERRLEERRPALWPHTEDVLDLTGRILRARQEVASKLAELREPAVCAAAEDLRRHVRELVPPRFPALIPYARLQHVPRYLQADLRRLERLRGGLERDGARLGELQPLLEQWHRRRADHERRFIDDPALEEYRWMLEEMRVSLFAQELGTACPVSSRRLAAQWALVQG